MARSEAYDERKPLTLLVRFAPRQRQEANEQATYSGPGSALKPMSSAL